MVRRIARTSFSGASLARLASSGHLDVDAEAVGISAGFGDQRVIGFRNGLEMDVAAKMMLLAQFPRHADHLFHGVVGAADDAGGEKQSLDIIAAIEVERQFHDFIDVKRARGTLLEVRLTQ